MPTSCSPTPSTGARAQQGPCRTPLLSPSTENLLVTIFIATNKQIIQINETYVLTAHTLARSGFASACQHAACGSLSARRFAPCQPLQLRSYPSAHKEPLRREGGLPSLPPHFQTT